jgi:hypothetical protein
MSSAAPAQGKGSEGVMARMRDNARPHASIPERRVDMWEALHTTFVRGRGGTFHHVILQAKTQPVIVSGPRNQSDTR